MAKQAAGAANAARHSGKKEHRKKPSAAWVLFVLVAVVVVVAAAVYFAGVAAFSYYFMPATSINGKNVSLVSAADLAEQVSEKGASYTAQVEGRGIETELSGADIGLAYDGEAFADAAISQLDKWRWPLELTSTHDLELIEPVTYDEDKLDRLVSGLVTEANKNRTAPQDAGVVYDSAEKGFVVKHERSGTMLSHNAVLQTIAKGVTALEPRIELDADDLVQPEVRSDDERLAVAADKANRYIGNALDLMVGKKKAYSVTSADILEWVKLDSSLDVTLDGEAARKWAQGPLSKQLDTVGAKRKYKRADGKRITVSGGTYGWVIDGAALAEDLVERIQQGNTSELQIPMKTKGAKWKPGGADWKRYIDVDLSEQHARMYDDSGTLVWESDFVSGLAKKKSKRATPEGVYTVLDKKRDQTLIGLDEDKDGKPDYESKVSYWMPFNGNLIGLHDAPWRTKFGGKIYKTDGSHGCVNLPSAKAAELYDLVSVGDVVSVHK